MLLVLVFIALAMSLYAVSYRHMAAALRVETARTLQTQRNQGSIHALAKGLALLETGLPPSDPYVCATTMETSTGEHSFTVTFSSETDEVWLVEAGPTVAFDDPQAMPDSFAEDVKPKDKPKKKPKKEKGKQPVKAKKPAKGAK